MEAAMDAPERTGLKGLMGHRGYMTALVSNTVSRFGDSIDTVAFSWMVYEITGSTLLMGTVFAVSGIPNLLFGFIAGAVVDRLPKRPVVVAGHFARALGVGLMAAVYAAGALESWMIFVFVFFNSTVEAFAHPASAGFMQRLVPKDAYMEANSLSQSASSIAELAGLGLAGFFLATIGIAGAIAIDAGTFLFAALGIAGIRLQGDGVRELAEGAPGPKPGALDIRSLVRDMGEGFSFLRQDRLVRITVLLAVFANFALVPFSALQPAFVKDVLGSGPIGMSVLGIGFSSGIALGGLALAKFGGKASRIRLILTGFMCIGALYACFALPVFLPTAALRLGLAGALSFLTGASLPLVNATIGAYLMEKTPPQLMGRTMSALSVAATCAMPLGAAFAGAAAELIGIPALFMALGLGTVLVTLFALSRPAIQAELKPELPPRGEIALDAQ
jgi:MFS transporter, DHA3 family, macrolide efflux protein